MKTKTLTLCLWLVLSAVGLITPPAVAETPNIVIILADDMGYGDLGCYGHPSMRAPNLDRMAAEGLRFTDFYAGASLCTPSRAGLLTGRLAVRTGMAGGPGRHVLYPKDKGGLQPEEITIARALYGDTVEELDWSVGQVLKSLHEEKLDRNTMVFYTSDNGPWLMRKWNGGSSGLLRDGKGGTWEGGYRVPAIAWWPKTIQPAVTHEIASGLDLFNTCLALAKVSVPTDRPLDGFDLTPVLLGNGKSKREVQFCYYGDQLYAVRKGAYKAHFITHDGYSKAQPEQHNPPLLFNIPEDPSEQFDVAAEHPEQVAELTKVFDEHRATVTHSKVQY